MDAGRLHKQRATWGKSPARLMHDTGITDGAHRLYCHMHWRYGQNHSNFEGQRSMAEMLGVSEKTIRNRIVELVAHDWVIVIERELNPKTGQFQTRFYEVFERQSDCRAYRSSYQERDGERMLPKPAATRERKLRAGIGGNPEQIDHRRNSSSTGDHRNSSSAGHRNSSSDYKESDSDLSRVLLLRAREDNPNAILYSAYESDIGLLTPMIRDDLADWLKQVPAPWIVDAIRESARQNKRSMSYISGILKRWQRDGRQDVSTVAAQPEPAEKPAEEADGRLLALIADLPDTPPADYLPELSESDRLRIWREVGRRAVARQRMEVTQS